MKCAYCLKDVESGTKYCPHCGKKMLSESSQASSIKASPQKAFEARELPPQEAVVPDVFSVEDDEDQAFEMDRQENVFDVDDHVDEYDRLFTAYEQTIPIPEDEMDRPIDEEDVYEDIGYKPNRQREKPAIQKSNRGFLLIVILAVLSIAAIVYFVFFRGGLTGGSGSYSLEKASDPIEAGSISAATDLVVFDGGDSYTLSVKDDGMDYRTPGTYTVIYTVTNTSSNKTEEVTLEFEVVDTTAPQLTSTEITIPQYSAEDIRSYFVVTDNADDTIPLHYIVLDKTIDTNTAGTYSVEVTLNDSSGNSKTVSATVIIKNVGDASAFYNKVSGTWAFSSDESRQLVIKQENGKYTMLVGQANGHADGGEFVFTEVNDALTNATLRWTYAEGTTSSTYTVKIDTGPSGDGLMDIDFGQGAGWQELTFVKD